MSKPLFEFVKVAAGTAFKWPTGYYSYNYTGKLDSTVYYDDFKNGGKNSRHDVYILRPAESPDAGREGEKLSVEYLQSIGFNVSSIANPFFGIYTYDLTRERCLSVHNPGTPNEIVFLTETSKDEEMQVFTYRNFDYDGYTSQKDLKNIISLLQTQNHGKG